MSGLEYVVRPVVFPDIRPTPSQSVPQKDNPNQGKATISGSSGKTIDLPYSYSISASQSRQSEIQRRVDVARVYQVTDDQGTVNKDNFVDISVANKIWMRDGQAVTPNYFRRIQETNNVEIREYNMIVTNQ